MKTEKGKKYIPEDRKPLIEQLVLMENFPLQIGPQFKFHPDPEGIAFLDVYHFVPPRDEFIELVEFICIFYDWIDEAHGNVHDFNLWLAKERRNFPDEDIAIPLSKKSRKKERIPKNIRWTVWERDNFTCKHCGTRRNLEVDHIFPESKGGSLEMDNLQTLCKPCNIKKGDTCP